MNQRDEPDWGCILIMAGIAILIIASLTTHEPETGPRPDPNPAPSPSPCPGPGPCPRPGPRGDETRKLQQAHNAERTKHGKSALSVEPRLQLAAQRHADFMASKGRMAHTGIGDGTPTSRANAAGYAGSYLGENVAMGQETVERVMTAWMHSPGHRSNILGRYRDFGAAVAWDGRGRPYWCGIFGSPGSTPASHVADAPYTLIQVPGQPPGTTYSPLSMSPAEVKAWAEPFGGDGPEAAVALINLERTLYGGVPPVKLDQSFAGSAWEPHYVASGNPSAVASADSWLWSPLHRAAVVRPDIVSVAVSVRPDGCALTARTAAGTIPPYFVPRAEWPRFRVAMRPSRAAFATPPYWEE